MFIITSYNPGFDVIVVGSVWQLTTGKQLVHVNQLIFKPHHNMGL